VVICIKLALWGSKVAELSQKFGSGDSLQIHSVQLKEPKDNIVKCYLTHFHVSGDHHQPPCYFVNYSFLLVAIAIGIKTA